MKDYLKKYEELYKKFPKISIKKLWHHGYWDGPTSGICEYNQQKCWFELIDEFHDKYSDFDDDDFRSPYYRRYLVHRLTEEQFKVIAERHEKFCRMVGYHTNYDEDGHRMDRFPPGHNITQESQDQYYKEAKQEDFPDISPVSEDHILGWYEW